MSAALVMSACGGDDDADPTAATGGSTADTDAGTGTEPGTVPATDPATSDGGTLAGTTEPATTDQGEPATLTTVTAGVPLLTNFTPVLWGIELGFFEDEGIDLQINADVAGPAVVPAVAAGQLDVGVTVWAGMIPAVAQDLPLTGFAGINQALTAEDPNTIATDTIALTVLNDSPIESAADIAGATIAVPNVASLAAIEVHQIAAQAGLTIDDYELVQVDFPNMATALRSGQVDAAYVTEPFLTALVASGDVRLIPGASQSAVSPGQPAGVMVANSTWADEHPDLVAAIQRALRTATEYAREHEDELRAALPDLLGIDPAVADSITLPNYSAEFEVADIQAIADTMLEYQVLQEPIDVSAHVIPMP